MNSIGAQADAPTRSPRPNDRTSEKEIVMATNVADVMTTEPVSIPADAPARDAARLMRDNDTGDVFVVDGDRLVGIVTDRDIVVRLIAEGRDPGGSSVLEACSTEIETVTPRTSLSDAAELMRLRAVRRLPVVEDDRPVGVISLGDLAIEKDEESVLGQVSAMPGNR
jgi:CBS domain-containing protein